MVIVESVFDENLTKEVNRQQLTSKWWLILIFELLFGGLGVIYLIENVKSMAILFFAFAILYVPLVLILIVILQRKANKTMSIMSNKTIQKFEFSEDKILIVDQKGEDYYAETKIKYNLLFRAYETKKAYILYISNRQ